MKRALAVVAIIGAASLAWAPIAVEAGADKQKTQTQTPSEKKMEQGKVAEGKIKAVDKDGKWVELEDGTKLTVPASVKVVRTDLKIGTEVKAQYQDQGGEKVVTGLQLKSKTQTK